MQYTTPREFWRGSVPPAVLRDLWGGEVNDTINIVEYNRKRKKKT